MKHLLLLPFLLIFTTLLSQQNEDRLTPQDHIQLLKKSALLVRLKTKSNTIKALEERGETTRAMKVSNEQKKKNIELVKAFRGHFYFCNVYFFYSSDTKHVKTGNLDSITFLNDSLIPDANIKIKEPTYYTCEIGNVQQDDSKYKEGYRIENTENGAEKKTTYSGGSRMSFQALIIKDSGFNQLASPFPYYSRTLSSLPIRKTYDSVVKKLNSNLEIYYAKVMRTQAGP